MTMTHGCWLAMQNTLSDLTAALLALGWEIQPIEKKLPSYMAIRFYANPIGQMDDPVEGAIFSDEPKAVWIHVDPWEEFPRDMVGSNLEPMDIRS